MILSRHFVTRVPVYSSRRTIAISRIPGVQFSERQSIHCLERRAGDSFLFSFFFLRKQIESPGESQGRRGIMTRRCFLRKRLIDNRSRRGTAKLYTRMSVQNFQKFRHGKVPRSSTLIRLYEPRWRDTIRWLGNEHHRDTTIEFCLQAPGVSALAAASNWIGKHH